MGFWAGERLERAQKNAPVVHSPEGEGKGAGTIDCNAITLTVGQEIYISPSQSGDKEPGKAIIQLKEKESFTVPAGQFAFLISEEVVKIPSDAMAFISIKSTHKFKGLINASGFHVDPGFHGQLTFAVFNAGPRPITLRRGLDAFLIWFADLTNNDSGFVSEKIRKTETEAVIGLNPNKLSGISGEIHSFKGLLARIEETEKKLNDRLHAVEKEHAVIKWALMLFVGALIGYVAKHIG